MPRATQVSAESRLVFAYVAITLYGWPFQTILLTNRFVTLWLLTEQTLQPHMYFYIWFGLFRFRSPLLTESLLISFPGGTEMFHFPPFASYTYGFSV